MKFDHRGDLSGCNRKARLKRQPFPPPFSREHGGSALRGASEVFDSPPPFYSMYVCILSEQSEESIHTDNTYLNLIFQTSIQSA